MNINILGLANRKIKSLAINVAKFCLDYLNQPQVELTIKFVSSREIRRLNREFRGIDRVTDVLSFPATDTQVGQNVEGGDGTYLGDMAICLKRAKKQAKEFENSVFAEIQKLIIHSVLHLLGYDHIEDRDYEIMNAKEEEIRKAMEGENNGI